jgi:hypothetical protein
VELFPLLLLPLVPVVGVDDIGVSCSNKQIGTNEQKKVTWSAGGGGTTAGSMGGGGFWTQPCYGG